MKDDLCSIIIPTYKGSDSILPAVRSALGQVKVEKEVLVIDDNGLGTEEQKKTESILRELIAENAIQYICHDVNRNGSAARNTGLRNSKGNFIAFLDDDDYILPEKTYLQMEALNQDPDCVMCVCGGCYVNLRGIGYRKVLSPAPDFLYQYLLDKLYFNTSAILFRKNALIEVGGFDESFRRHQDWELVTRVLALYQACVLPEIEMVRYLEERNNPASYEQRINNLEHFFDKCEPFMLKKLSKEQVERVKTFRRREICQSMLRGLKVREAFAYGKRYGGPLEFVWAGTLLAPLAFRKLLYGNRKVAPEKQELFQAQKTL